MNLQRECKRCGGEKTVKSGVAGIDVKCPECNGTGKEKDD